MIRNEDRIYVTNQTLDQVIEFLKINLKNADTAVDKAMGKVVKNREDQSPPPDKGMPQKDKPKILPLTNEKPSETKNKEKNYTEKQVKTESDINNHLISQNLWNCLATTLLRSSRTIASRKFVRSSSIW